MAKSKNADLQQPMLMNSDCLVFTLNNGWNYQSPGLVGFWIVEAFFKIKLIECGNITFISSSGLRRNMPIQIGRVLQKF